MNALAEIKNQFASVLAEYVDDPDRLLAMIRPAQDPKFGDYQANCAMPLKNQVGKPPREIAAELVSKVDLGQMCTDVDIAGPGFINLKLDDVWLKSRLKVALTDPRLGVQKTASPKNFVVDFSSPNVAKPMHVGHIRSTVIGDSLARILRFMGHHVITDNHLGDWGTQFGMLIYGFKHFVDQAAYEKQPIAELTRLYRYVRAMMDYQANVQLLPAAEQLLEKQQVALERVSSQQPADAKEAKKQTKDIGRLNEKIAEQTELIRSLKDKILQVESDSKLLQDAQQHIGVGERVLLETAKLHDGDAENKRLWEEFLPLGREDIQQIYRRLNIEFDYELGESFYHSQLSDVVSDFVSKGLARESEGAICVFMDDYETPMIIQKKDGAFLYATTDLATIKHRVKQWQTDVALYIVDHRQHQHFEKVFDAARLWGCDQIELVHVSFGTVLGEDGKPIKTRSGDTIGLQSLLDRAEAGAMEIAREVNSELDLATLEKISKVVGIGSLKYADLSHNRASDYKFSYKKMLNLKGNTATYLQYGYARVQGIIRKVIGEEPESLEAFWAAIQGSPFEFVFANDVERQLAVRIIQFEEALEEVLLEYKPNFLCNYLYELAQTFGQFFEKCHVKDAESEALQKSRLQLCLVTGKVLKIGLGLLGIEVLDRM